MFSKKATKIEKIFTVDLHLLRKRQIDGEDLVNFCGLLRKHELYQTWKSIQKCEGAFFFLLRFLWLLQGKCQKHIKLQANVCWRNAKPTMNYDRYSIKDDCEINFLPHFPPKSFCQIARQSLTRKISTNLKGVVRIMEQNPIWSYIINLLIYLCNAIWQSITIFKTYI